MGGDTGRASGYPSVLRRGTQRLPSSTLPRARSTGRWRGTGRRSRKPPRPSARGIGYGEVLAGRARLRRRVARVAEGREHAVSAAEIPAHGLRRGRRFHGHDLHSAASDERPALRASGRMTPGGPGAPWHVQGWGLPTGSISRPCPVPDRSNNGAGTEKIMPCRTQSMPAG